MELLRLVAGCLILAELSTLTEGYPKDHISHAKKKEEPAKSRSYIDIDASDPFKVPKSSHYVNKPMPDFDAKVENKEGEDEGPHRGHGRGEMGHEMDRMEEEGAKNMGRGEDREAENEREHMEREGREHEGGREREGGRESEGENFAEKSGAPSPENNVPEEQHGMIQPPQESSEAAPQEESANLANVAEMTEGAKGIQRMDQQVEADGKSVVQGTDPAADPMAGVMSSVGAEDGFKKGNVDQSQEEEPPLDRDVVNQIQ